MSQTIPVTEFRLAAIWRARRADGDLYWSTHFIVEPQNAHFWENVTYARVDIATRQVLAHNLTLREICELMPLVNGFIDELLARPMAA